MRLNRSRDSECHIYTDSNNYFLKKHDKKS